MPVHEWAGGLVQYQFVKHIISFRFFPLTLWDTTYSRIPIVYLGGIVELHSCSR